MNKEEEGLHTMCKCSLPYEDLVEAIKNGECDEQMNILKNQLNKLAQNVKDD